VVYEKRAPAHCAKCALIAQRDRCEIIVIADAGDNNIGVASRLRRALGQGTGMLTKPCLGLGCSTIEYG